MKRYIIFIASFLLLFSLFQFFSGMILTMLYTPNVEEAWNVSAQLSQETVLQGSNSSFILTLFSAFFAATIGFFTSKKIVRKK